jgi:hypothetical protein
MLKVRIVIFHEETDLGQPWLSISIQICLRNQCPIPKYAKAVRDPIVGGPPPLDKFEAQGSECIP